MAPEYPFWLGGRAGQSGRPLDVVNPFDGSIVARTWLAGTAEFERATEAALAAAPAVRALAAYERGAILSAASAEIKKRRDEIARVLAAFDALEVGGVIVNDVPTWRIDHMPYGGVKDSGLGREGSRYTIEEMTELKLLVINQQIA